MFRKVTLTEVRAAFQKQSIEALPGGEYFREDLSHLIGVPFDTIYPTELIINKQGKIIIPGDVESFFEKELANVLGIPPASWNMMISYNPLCTATGEFVERSDRLRFEFTHPRSAPHLLLLVKWLEPSQPRAAGVDSDFGRRVGAVYFHRKAPNLDAQPAQLGLDTWVIDLGRCYDPCLRSHVQAMKHP